ncbi:hypothetical protein MTP04_07750 [Lysinibacillus sp. PLM2]|nr:hypothetical protein MTP04_07750 [Lysinibacillus sp. PLM2]
MLDLYPFDCGFCPFIRLLSPFRAQLSLFVGGFCPDAKFMSSERWFMSAHLCVKSIQIAVKSIRWRVIF